MLFSSNFLFNILSVQHYIVLHFLFERKSIFHPEDKCDSFLDCQKYTRWVEIFLLSFLLCSLFRCRGCISGSAQRMFTLFPNCFLSLSTLELVLDRSAKTPRANGEPISLIVRLVCGHVESTWTPWIVRWFSVAATHFRFSALFRLARRTKTKRKRTIFRENWSKNIETDTAGKEERGE